MTEKKKYDNTNSGALFKNDRKDTEKHPDYTGQLNVAGHDYWLSAWLKTDRNGRKFMSLSVKQKDGKPAPREPENRQGAGLSAAKEMDDEIPW